jgi:hypothetical protein
MRKIKSEHLDRRTKKPTRWLPLYYFFALGICVLPFSSHSKAQTPTLAPAYTALASDFDQFSAYLLNSWANRQVHESLDQFSLLDRISEFKTNLQQNPPATDQEFYLRLRIFSLRLHDGHLTATFPKANWTNQQSAMTIEETSAGLFLTACDSGCPNLQLPAQITAFDDIDAETWINTQAETASGSTIYGRKYSVLRWLSVYYEGLVGERTLPSTLSVIDAAGNSSTFPFEYKSTATFPARDLTRCVWSENVNNTLVVHVTTFGCGQAPESDAVMTARFTQQLDQALANQNYFQNIILDLRGNGGGALNEAMALGGHFLVNPIFYYGSRLQNASDPTIYSTLLNPSTAPYPNESWLNQSSLWLLTDGGCFSQCSLFVKALSDAGRAQIIGSPVDAGAGGDENWPVPSGLWRTNVPTYQVTEADGSFLEGATITPSIATLPNANDFLNQDIESVFVQNAVKMIQ